MENVILAADDDPSILFIFERIFEGQARLITAPDGLKALDLLRKEQPPLAFLDVDMPGLNGLEVLEQARGCCPGTALWLLTANEDLSTITKAMALGATGYLTKPFEVSRLRDIAEDVFNKKENKPWSVKKPEDNTGT